MLFSASSAPAVLNVLRRARIVRRRTGVTQNHQPFPPQLSQPLCTSNPKRAPPPMGLHPGNEPRRGYGSSALGDPWSLIQRCGASTLILLSSASLLRRLDSGWLSGGSGKSAHCTAGDELSSPPSGRAFLGSLPPPGMASQRWRPSGVPLGLPPPHLGGGGRTSKHLLMQATLGPSTAPLFTGRAGQQVTAGMEVGERGEEDGRRERQRQRQQGD